MTTTTSKRVIHNTCYNLLTLVCNAIIGFLLIRFFLTKLGEEKYGVWIIIGSIFSYRSILSMGLNSSVNRYIPMYLVQNNNDGIKKVISTSLFFFSLLALVLIIVSLVVYTNIGNWFVIQENLISDASYVVLLCGLFFAAAMPLQLYTAVLSGLQRYDIISLATLIPLLVRTALLIVFLSLGHGLIIMGILYGTCELTIRLIQYIYFRKLMPSISVSWKFVDIKLLKEMLAYGINTLLYTMGALIIYKASDVIIGMFMSSAHVARFYVATAGVLLLAQLLHAFTRAIKPAVSDLDARNDKVRLREVAFLSQKYILLLLVPSVSFFVVMGRPFLDIWVGAKFTEAGVLDELNIILMILAIGHGVRLSQHGNFMILVGKGDHKVFGVLTAATAVLCVVLSVISVKIFAMGLIGIAWSIFVPMVVVSGFVLPVYFNRAMDIKFRETLKQVLVPVFAGTLPPVIVLFLWRKFYPPTSWTSLGLVVSVVMTVAFLSCWFLSIKTIERKRLLSIAFRNR